MLEGQIIKNISNLYTVLTSKGEYTCKPRGKFRNMGFTPLVGDYVKIDAENKIIWEILKRKNELNRPKISNVDYALIVTSIKKPDLSCYLLDKEISSIILANIRPVICFTKLDLASEKELVEINHLRKYYESIDIPTFTNQDVSKLVEFLQNKMVVLTGQTGAGKSSLLNLIEPEKNLKVGEISEALGRGKHTTRHTEFHNIKNIWFADTPGFSSLDLTGYTKEEIRSSFKEFARANCLYRDCMHVKESDCEVKRMVERKEILNSRYQNYKEFIK